MTARLLRLMCLLALIGLPQSAVAQSIDPTPHELQTIINERDKAYNQRFDAQEKAVAAALAAAKEAVTKAEGAAEKRFDSVNEFRTTLKDQQSTLITRLEVAALLKAFEDRLRAMDEKLQSIDSRVNQVIARSEGANWLFGVVLGVGGLIAGAAMAAAAIRKRPAR